MQKWRTDVKEEKTLKNGRSHTSESSFTHSVRYICSVQVPSVVTSQPASSQDMALSSLKPLACPSDVSGPMWGEQAHLHSAAPIHHRRLCPCTQHDNYHVARDETLILLLIHQPATESRPWIEHCQGSWEKPSPPL